MVFSSLTFLYIFLPLCLISYFVAKNIKAKNIILLVFSLIFYAWGEPKYILLLVATTFVDYICGLLILKYKGTKKEKLFLALACVITLSSLGLFKYTGFFCENLNSIFSFNIPGINITLPIGISFYTFQALTYVIDVYRGRVRVQGSFYKLLLYVSMFPQLIAGPIVRYSDVEEQIENRSSSLKSVSAGIIRFSTGLLKKAIVANLAGELTTKLIGGDIGELTAVGAWVGIIAYTIQIYFDFSGYSDMAIGLGLVFGFHFPENFNYPYCAKSITDFWKRWHMTLTSFFRDYLYIPMGGNRKRWALNMLVVWLLTGLWHGASWNFVLWGLYYFFFLMLEKVYIGKYIEKWHSVLQHLYSLVIIVIGWAFFYFDDMAKLKYFFKAMFGIANGFVSLTQRTIVINYIVLLAVGIIASLPIVPCVKKLALKASRPLAGRIAVDLLSVIYVAAVLFISTAALVGNSYNPFLYFRF